MSEHSISEIAARIKERITDLATELLGNPNRNLSTAKELRFGNKGSVSVELDGPKAGVWYDHERGKGGDGLELISFHHNCTRVEATDWARNWLSLTNGSTAKESTKSKIADVRCIVAESRPAAGTPAELYLRNRGITAALPDCVRYRPRAFGGYGAMVVLATDDEGRPLAVQQVYLTDDGRKALLEVVKRTRKAVDRWSEKAAVRLPGKSPVVLAEGPETALSIWQATGHETWACLGVANIGKAPLPKNAPVTVARDGDTDNAGVNKTVNRAIQMLQSRGHDVTVATPPAGQDFNDVLIHRGEDAVRAAFANVASANTDPNAWRSGLRCTKHGEPLGVLTNAILALRRAPEWNGVLCYDAFANVTMVRTAPPWVDDKQNWVGSPWTDCDDILTADWLQRQGILVSPAVACQAVEVVARDHEVHPVRAYLNGLEWDGKPRIDLWLRNYLGVDDTEYSRAVGSRWLISAIARVFVPGCQVDHVLILEGKQELGKSSALRELANPWFTDRLSDMNSKDAAMETCGVWIIEIAELDSIRRSDVATTKAFLTRMRDRIRPPWGRRVVNLARQCVFAGTVNPDGSGYLKDATGGRRFWPVRCGAIDLEALKRDRDQLWAEARERFNSGESHWLDTAELKQLAAEEQADRHQADPWQETIAKYLDDGTGYPKQDVSVGEVLEQALGIPPADRRHDHEIRVARCLTRLKYERKNLRLGADREWRYRRMS